VRARNKLLPQDAILTLVLLTVCASWARADETIELTPGFVKLFKFDRAVSTVVIGDPRVAEPLISYQINQQLFHTQKTEMYFGRIGIPSARTGNFISEN